MNMNMNMNRTIAVIPVKKHSTRLPGKNLKSFFGESLLERKIGQLQKVKIIDHIVVSTDCTIASKQAKALGVEVDHRPLDLADESRPLGDFFEYICNKYNSYSTLVWACCTSPLFDEAYLLQALEAYRGLSRKEHDSLIVTTAFKHYLMDASGPLNYKLGDGGHVNSQDLPELEVFTNGVVIAEITDVLAWRYNYGSKAYRLKVPQSVAVDIDTQEDYLAALAWSDRL